MFATFKRIAVKLAVLAGVPVIGALLLSAHIAGEARERARSAAGIGSIEDLAELSSRMTDTIAELQAERALAALSVGFEAADTRVLEAQRSKTNRIVRDMEELLATHDFSRLPREVGQDLARARDRLRQLGAQRETLLRPNASIDQVLRLYGETNDELIKASASLTRLSNDGELLRALSALVSTMQVKERSSREHAVLSNTFAHREFAPGLYRHFVALVTEEAVYIASFKTLASKEEARLLEKALRGQAFERAARMRKLALETTEDVLDVDAQDWYEAQRQKIAVLSELERELAGRARGVARDKVAAAEAAVIYSRNLVLAVVVSSLLMTWVVGRKISRSVRSLTDVAGRVQKEQDFALRAEKSSNDELGLLTDAFNEMLSGIQRRDGELQAHRENLEALVRERTAELQQRNEDLRLVMNTVDQGLVVVQPNGEMSSERSRAFDEFFGAAPAGQLYYDHIAEHDPRLAVRLRLDWEQLCDGFMPMELLLEQSLSRFERNGRQYSLAYKPMLKQDSFDGALLTVSDVTAEVAARRAEAEQREQVAAVACVLRDRSGFLAFFNESRRLLERICDERAPTEADRMRAIHTLKGNAALFHVSSVTQAAHVLEQALLDGELERASAFTLALSNAWDAFSARIVALVGEDFDDRYELTRSELEELRAAAKPYPRIAALVHRIGHEPLRTRFLRSAEQLQQLAARLGKADVEVLLNDDGVRLPGAALQSFWAAFAHVVRNVADHGLETSEEREQVGKPPKNRVELKATRTADGVTIEVIDDGRGIDWTRVRERAHELGLDDRTRERQVALLFEPGFSTTRSVSTTSGRGVGLAAIQEVCRGLGGRCTLEGERGQGVRMAFTLPASALS